MHRLALRTIHALAIAALIAILAGPAVAKIEYEVRLDAPIPRDAVEGSLVDVGFTVSSPYDPAAPFLGVPVFIRLQPRAPGAEATEATGVESSPGSGHYVAQVMVPAGGIAAVEAGLRNQTCTAGQGCSRIDYLLAILGDTLGPPTRGCETTETPGGGA
jgi:hypothetical protein